MFQYLEALVANKELTFPPELLRPMYELYLDLSLMYVNRINEQRQAHYLNNDFLGRRIIHSGLIADLRLGLNALSQEDRLEIEPRFIDNENTINMLKAQSASPGPSPGLNIQMSQQQPLMQWGVNWSLKLVRTLVF